MLVEYYENYGEPIIWTKKRIGKEAVIQKIDNFNPYFYVLEEQKYLAQKELCVTSVLTGFKSIFGEDLVKVFTKTPKDVGRIRNNFYKTYEADILFTNRYLIDTEPDFGDIPKILFLDIEVDVSEKDFPEPSQAKYPINAVSFISSYNDNRYLTIYFPEGGCDTQEYEIRIFKNRITGQDIEWQKIRCRNEKELFEQFVKYVNIINPDYLSGWNSEFFDMPYIINRARNIGFDINKISPFNSCFVPPPMMSLATGKMEEKIPKIKGRGIFDLRIPYKKMNTMELQSYALNRVGEAELGVKKLEYTGSLYNLYREDLEKFLLYNMADVELCNELNKKVKVIEYFWDFCKFIGCVFGDTMSSSRMWDMYSLRYNKKNKGFALPTKIPTKPQTFEGAIVFEPETGMHKNVIVLDLSKIYPSIILSMNVSPETLVKSSENITNKENLISVGNGCYFRKDIEGFTPKMLKELFIIEDIKKKEIKVVAEKYGYGSVEHKRAITNRQFVKDHRNAMYGMLSYVGFRLYVPEAGASITYVGRKIITFCKEFIESEGYKVVAGDTDSLFIVAKGSTIEENIIEGNNLTELINKNFDNFAKGFNIDNHFFKIEFEKIYESMIILAKKRYDAYICYTDGKQVRFRDTKGIESKRSDNPLVTKKFILDVLDMIHQGKNKGDIELFAMDNIKEMIGKGIEEIAVPKALHKGIDNYKADFAHVRGAKYANEHFKLHLGKGSKPYFVYISKVPVGYPQTDVLCFDTKEQIPAGFEIDYKAMIDKLLLKKLESIFESMSWGETNIIYNYTNNELTFQRQVTLV